MKAVCINLDERYGDRFQVAYDESYTAQHGRNARTDDPHLQIIPCKHGHIYPHGSSVLGASTNNRGAIANRLTKLPCCHVVQDGSDGVNVTFDAEHFDEVAAIIRPCRRRGLSPERRERLIDNGQPGRDALARRRNRRRSEDT